MRPHRKKFPLIFRDGTEINTMADLRKNFDFKKVMGYFQNKKLASWLDDRFYSDEADALNELKPNDRNTPRKICNILGVDYEKYYEELDDAETVAWRAQRREHLKKFTDDPEIIKKVDNVAFNQEDLEDILRESPLPNKIYLCDNFFRFPSGILRKEYIAYVGIGNVSIKFETKKPVDISQLEITFENIKFTDEEPTEEVFEEEIVEEEEETVEEVPVVEEPQQTFRFMENLLVQVNFLPASAVTQTALRFKSRIMIRFDGKTMDAKSVMLLRTRGLVKGQKATITIEGSDSKDAMDAFIELFEKGPQKDYPTAAAI